LNQKAENIEAIGLGESGEPCQCILLFHTSIEVEILADVKWGPRAVSPLRLTVERRVGQSSAVGRSGVAQGVWVALVAWPGGSSPTFEGCSPTMRSIIR
jgi:hypothetical protein